MLIAVHNSWHDGVSVSARTDDEQEHQEERLEVEERRLESLLAIVNKHCGAGQLGLPVK